MKISIEVLCIIRDNVGTLVYLGAFAPEEGEKVGELTTRFPRSSWRSSESENLR